MVDLYLNILLLFIWKANSELEIISLIFTLFLNSVLYYTKCINNKSKNKLCKMYLNLLIDSVINRTAYITKLFIHYT